MLFPSEKESRIMQLLMQHGEMYGFQLVEQGKLKKGTVYVTLDRMEDKGYVESRQEQLHSGAIGLPRRFYKLTSHGKRVIQAWEQYGAALEVVHS